MLYGPVYDSSSRKGRGWNFILHTIPCLIHFSKKRTLSKPRDFYKVVESREPLLTSPFGTDTTRRHSVPLTTSLKFWSPFVFLTSLGWDWMWWYSGVVVPLLLEICHRWMYAWQCLSIKWKFVHMNPSQRQGGAMLPRWMVAMVPCYQNPSDMFYISKHLSLAFLDFLLRLKIVSLKGRAWKAVNQGVSYVCTSYHVVVHFWNNKFRYKGKMHDIFMTNNPSDPTMQPCCHHVRLGYSKQS